MELTKAAGIDEELDSVVFPYKSAHDEKAADAAAETSVPGCVSLT